MTEGGGGKKTRPCSLMNTDLYDDEMREDPFAARNADVSVNNVLPL